MNKKQKVPNDRHEQIRMMRKAGLTYQEIGDYFKISRERVRQILDRYNETGRRTLSTPTTINA